MEATFDREEVTPATRKPDVLGHPRGLWTLAGTEVWDRISFHGMVSMLVLYMTGTLLKPGAIEQVAGFAAYHGFLEKLYGTLSPLAIATHTFAFYYAGVTFLPIVGGWLGDKVLSRRVAVAIGALLMTAGHLCMAFNQTFLLALTLLACGAGMLRGNLAPQIRSLYRAGDRRLADAFQIYSLSVNLGAFIAPIVSGAVAKYYGWHAGFGVAGFGMLIGLIWYLAGSRYLPPEPARGAKVHHPPLTAAQKRNALGLLLVWPTSVAFWTAQAQIWNVYNLWVRDHIQMRVGGFDVPVPWLQSLDGLAPAAYAPLVIWLWRWQAKRGTEPDMFVKLAIGCLIFAAATALLAAAPAFADGAGRGPLWLPILFHLFSNLGAVFFAPVMQAFFAARAPERWRGTMLGVYTMSVAAASLLSGTMGGWYEQMTPSAFWLLDASIVGVAGIALLVANRPLRAWLGAEREEEGAPAPDLPAPDTRLSSRT